MTDGPDVATLLDERPDLEPAVEAALTVEAKRGDEPWTFDDIEADSGTFGELVSRGIIEPEGDGYRLADVEATRAALDGESGPTTDTGGTGDSLPTGVDLSIPTVDPRVAAALLGGLAAVVVFRITSLPSVFRDGVVVLSGNDPYFYRYWVEQVVTTSGFDLGLLSSLPPGIANGEPLLVGILSLVATVLGGPSATGSVLAWYPVVAAVLTAGLLYLLAVEVTGDRRIGLAAVLFLAVLPAHTMRTSLGYADHHALDYVWLTLTATALAFLYVDTPARRRTLGWTAGLGVGIGFQVLSWDAGPLLVAAIAPVVVGGTLLDVRAGRSPVATHWPVLLGIGLGAAIAWIGHGLLSWHTTTVVAVPSLLFVGAVAVVAAGELTRRAGRPVRELAALEVVVGAMVLAGLAVLTPDLWGELLDGIATIARTGSGIAEVAPLVSRTAMGGLFLLGLVHVFAIPVMAWAAWRVYRGESRWLVPATYAWFFLGLALFQVRFLGEFAPFGALFAGLAFVWLASRVDLARRPVPFATDGDRWRPDVPSARTVGALLALFVLVGGFAAIQGPVKTSQLTIEDGTYETAAWLAEYADDRELADDDRYVFSNWGRNRVYNYFLSGESRSYGFAQANYAEFLGATNESEWYDRLDGRARFVVTTDDIANAPPETHQHRLHENLGSRGEGSDGLGHYRVLFVTGDRSRAAFELVSGATLTGPAPANTSVTVSTDVTVGGETVPYVRETTTDSSGNYSIVVAHPGEYTVSVDGDERSVSVSESAVLESETVRAETD